MTATPRMPSSVGNRTRVGALRGRLGGLVSESAASAAAAAERSASSSTSFTICEAETDDEPERSTMTTSIAP